MTKNEFKYYNNLKFQLETYKKQGYYNHFGKRYRYWFALCVFARNENFRELGEFGKQIAYKLGRPLGSLALPEYKGENILEPEVRYQVVNDALSYLRNKLKK
jgi:hypothetical protein